MKLTFCNICPSFYFSRGAPLLSGLVGVSYMLVHHILVNADRKQCVRIALGVARLKNGLVLTYLFNQEYNLSMAIDWLRQVRDTYLLLDAVSHCTKFIVLIFSLMQTRSRVIQYPPSSTSLR